MTRVTLTTAGTPGAVAILQLHGDDVTSKLEQLTGRSNWLERRAYLVDFAGIDEGLTIKFNETTAQLMPHGGPRVVQRLLEHLTHKLGCSYDAEPKTLELYPEAKSPIEADMLHAIAFAASPAAIDALAPQPDLWRDLMAQGTINRQQDDAIMARSKPLGKLIGPATVVVIGPANAGKSTLINALLGRSVSIVADLPGTTRDWVGGLVELSATGSMQDAVAVQWLDTPGLRDSDDPIEQRAIELAKEQIDRADVLVAMRDQDQGWPDLTNLNRLPELWIVNKVDDAASQQLDKAGHGPNLPLEISAMLGVGLDLLQKRVIDCLGLTNIETDQPWLFSKRLIAWSLFRDNDLSDYLQDRS